MGMAGYRTRVCLGLPEPGGRAEGVVGYQVRLCLGLPEVRVCLGLAVVGYRGHACAWVWRSLWGV